MSSRKSLLSSFSDELAGLVGRIGPGVVALSGKAGQGAYYSTGSAFCIDTHGHVVTNAHVIEDVSGPIEAALPGGTKTTASVIGVDPLTDLALLRLEHKAAAFLRFRRDRARLGEICLALGNPLGRFPESVSLGIVSGLSRTVWQEVGRPIYGSIQTDCAVNHGNSGGPLVDVRGEVLGVNNRKVEGADNVGFAIPADTVLWVVGQLLERGEVRRASLGVRVRKVVATTGNRRLRGLEVVEVPGAQAKGLRPGDLIIGVAGTIVREIADILPLLTAERIGKPLALEIVRGGQRREVVVRPKEFRLKS
jgi:S1-C subfamily serine protease